MKRRQRVRRQRVGRRTEFVFLADVAILADCFLYLVGDVAQPVDDKSALWEGEV
jgi:hypothetical protein